MDVVKEETRDVSLFLLTPAVQGCDADYGYYRFLVNILNDVRKPPTPFTVHTMSCVVQCAMFPSCSTGLAVVPQDGD